MNRIVKVTARVGENLAGRCRAAYIDGVLEGGPASFEAWVVEAMTAALTPAEKKRGAGMSRLPRTGSPRGDGRLSFQARQLTRPTQVDSTPQVECRYFQHCQQWDAALVLLMSVRERIGGPPRRRPRTSSIPAGELTPTRGGDWVMTKGHRPSRVRRLGLDGKQKAQIAVAVVTTLPQLIWAIAFLLSAR